MRTTSLLFASFLVIAGCSSTASPNDGGPDAAVDCGSDADCTQGQICVFQSPGCATRGVCATDFACGRVSLPYCGCDGVTFFDHCAGPGGQWVSQCGCPTQIGDGGISDAGGAPD